MTPASPTPKAYTLGAHRAVPPEETVRRIGNWFDRFEITRVADITGLDRIGIPVMAAYRPTARSLAVSMGKGVTAAAAVASAVMESIELWHAERPRLERIWGCANDLGAGHRLIDWSALPRIPGFDACTATAWVEVASLVDGSPLLAPYECVHTDGRFPEPPGSGGFVCTSNGLASGNNVVEAQVHALCEVIERDAITLWRLGASAEATTIDHRSISDAVCGDLIARLEAANLAVLLHDATSDLGIPVLHCTLLERDPEPDLTLYATSGMGCHPSPAVALSRALTEAAQSRLTLISGARDDLFRPRYEVPADAASWLNGPPRSPGPGARAFADLPDRSTATLEGDLDAVLGAMRGAGLEPCWADLAQPDIGIAVGRAIVPGLELFNDVADYRPGPRARAVREAVSG